MQPGGRLVEDVDGPTVGALLQLGRELDPLRLSSGEGGRGLPEADVAQPDGVERLHVSGDRRDRGEEVLGLLDRHVEDLRDVLALEVHLEGLPVVPRPVADLARHVDIGEEVHLDLQRAVARAGIAPTSLDVEGEATGLVATDLGLARLGEETTDPVEDPGVGRGVGPGGPADRALIDVDDLVEVLETGDGLVAARDLAGAVELVGEHLVEDVVDERGLARAGDPGDGDEGAEGEAHVDAVEVVLTGPLDRDLPTGLTRTAGHREADLVGTGEEATGRGPLVGEETSERSGVDDVSPVLTSAGTDVDDPVRCGDGVLVVLDDDEGVAEVAQPGQRLDEAVVVALVQADARLVEDVEDADEPRADLRRQPDPLGLAAGQGAGRP